MENFIRRVTQGELCFRRPSLGFTPLSVKPEAAPVVMQVLCSSKVLTSKPFPTFQASSPPCPTPFDFSATQCCAETGTTPRGQSSEWSLCLASNCFIYLFIFLSFWSLPGEKPNLCWLQGGASWKGVRDKKMGSQIPAGFYSTSRLQSGSCQGVSC